MARKKRGVRFIIHIQLAGERAATAQNIPGKRFECELRFQKKHSGMAEIFICLDQANSTLAESLIKQFDWLNLAL